MAYQNSLMKKLNLSKGALKKGGKEGVSAQDNSAPNIADIMLDPRYLRQSSALINDALQKGFDVLQLSDGNIIMTGTKTIVHRYEWELEKGKLMKTKTTESGPVMKRSRKSKEDAEAVNEDESEEV